MQNNHSHANAGANPSLASEPTNDLQALVIMFFRNSWLISLCLIVAVLAAAVYYKRAPRIYQASTTLQVEQEEQRVLKIEQVVQEDLRTAEILNTIVQKLRSEPLLERVLETNGITDASKLFPDREDGAAPMSRDQLLRAFSKMVKTSLRRNTRLINVTVSLSHPQLAAKLANSIVNQYMIQETETRSSSTRGANTFLEDESDRLKKKLEKSELELQKYREEVGSVSMMQADDSIVLPQLRELSLRVTQAKSDSLRLEAAYEQVNAARGDVSELLNSPQISVDPTVADARTLAIKAENEFVVIQKRYKAKHPKYIQTAALVTETRQGLSNAVLKAAESVRVTYENVVKTERKIERSFREAQDRAIQVSQQAIRYNALAREVESDRALFESILNRLKETSLASELRSEKIRVIEPASVPDRPASPKMTLVFGIALMGGLMIGCVLAFGIGALDTSIKGVDDAEEYLGLTVLSAIPTLKETRKGGKALVAGEGSHSQGAEAFRTLRAALAMLGREEERRTFLFTSALPQEGKSFTSLNFAVSLAQQGLRTLLIDADLRRPSVAKYLADGDNQEMPGLADCLVGRIDVAKVVRTKQGVDHFYWMPAGQMSPNPAELLADGSFGALLDEILKDYDRVVVDSAPVHAVSDTLLIANKIQTTVLIVHGGKTPRRAVARCAQLLQKSGAKMGGLVLNLLPRRHSRGYGYYNAYYNYGHKGYYGQDVQKGLNDRRGRKPEARVEVPSKTG